MTAQRKHWDSVARAYVEGSAEQTHTAATKELAWPELTTGGGYVETGSTAAQQSDNDNRGPYISTYTGRFYMFDPCPADVRIKDIAHGLSRICRYTGAVREFYSVAEHSVHIARWLLKRYGPAIALQGLLHDSPEALSGFGDVARPAKQRAPIIKETEERIYTCAIAPAFGLPPSLSPEVHEADNRIIADEMQQGMHEVDPGYRDPLDIKLQFWPPDRAEIYFLDTFCKIGAMV